MILITPFPGCGIALQSPKHSPRFFIIPKITKKKKSDKAEGNKMQKQSGKKFLRQIVEQGACKKSVHTRCRAEGRWGPLEVEQQIFPATTLFC